MTLLELWQMIKGEPANPPTQPPPQTYDQQTGWDSSKGEYIQPSVQSPWTGMAISKGYNNYNASHKK